MNLGKKVRKFFLIKMKLQNINPSRSDIALLHK